MIFSANGSSIVFSAELSSKLASMSRGQCNAIVKTKRCKVEMVEPAVGEPQKLCSVCQTSATPLWRNGPEGPKSLCNACGIRYSKRKRVEFRRGKGRNPASGSCRRDGKSDAAEATLEMEEMKRRQREKQEKMLIALLRRRREMNWNHRAWAPARSGGGGEGEEVAEAARLLLFLSSSGLSLHS